MSKYWDDPEGTNCIKKTAISTKISAELGLIGGMYQTILHPADTTLESILKVAGPTMTMAAVGAIFGAVTCTAAHLREDADDPWNYFIGGCAAGTVFGARAHNFAVGTFCCLTLGGAGALTRLARTEGWKLYPSIKD